MPAAVLERFTERTAAERSPRWNGRRCDEFPPDYGRTLAEYRVWKAEQLNRQIDARLARARDELIALGRAVRRDRAWLDGFAAGVAERRDDRPPACPALIGEAFTARKADGPAGLDEEQTRAWQDGWRDGQAFAFWLRVLERAPDCYVEVPE
ncbi:MAG: hypothetical protein Kow0062_07490 [Acidobacteriota bacterium]